MLLQVDTSRTLRPIKGHVRTLRFKVHPDGHAWLNQAAREVNFESFWRENECRARELGLLTPEMTERMRTEGGNRTPEKSEVLRRIAERTRVAAVEPFKAC